MSKVTQHGVNGTNGDAKAHHQVSKPVRRRFGGRQMREWIEAEREQRKGAIGGLDAAWLLIEKETSFSAVCAATYTYKDLTYEKLIASSEVQMEKFPKYKQKLTDLGRRVHGPRFIDDENFDIHNHVKSIKLKEPAGKAELEALVSRFIAEPFDISRPLWDSIFISNYKDEHGANSAMVTRGHHTLADGQGFVISQLWMTSYQEEIEKMMNGGGEMLAKARKGTLKPSKMNKGLAALDGAARNPVTAPFVQALLFSLYWATQAGNLFVGLFWAMLHFSHAFWLFVATSWRMTKCTTCVERQPGLADALSYYHGPRVYEREFATSTAMPISDVKTVQKAFSGARPGSAVRALLMQNGVKAKQFNHVTLNDVVVACMTDVLRRTAEEVPEPQGLWPRFLRSLDHVLPVRIGIFIPVSLRPAGVWDMKNLSTGATVYMKPMNKSTRITPATLYDHIHQAKSELSIIKRSLLPQILFNWISLASQAPVLYSPLSLLPHSINQFIEDWFVLPWTNLTMVRLTTRPMLTGQTHFTAIVTNVPGPKEKVSLQGCDILSWTALPPQGGAGTLGIGIISYGPDFSISVSADHVPGSAGVAKRICDRFEKHFQKYVDVANEAIEADKHVQPERQIESQNQTPQHHD